MATINTLPTAPIATGGSAPSATPSLILLTSELSRALWLTSVMADHAQVLPSALEASAMRSCMSNATPAAQTVVVEFSESTLAQAIELVKELHRSPQRIAIVALGASNVPALTLAALRAGVLDFIDPSMDESDIRRTLSRLLQHHFPEPEQSSFGIAPPPSRPRGKVVALLGARTGVGVTTLASHLSVLLQENALQPIPTATSIPKTGEKISTGANSSPASQSLLMDLGLPPRDGQMYLNAHGDYSVVDAIQGMHRLDKTLLNAAVAHHESGTSLLSWPSNLQSLRELSPGIVGSLVSRLRDFWPWQVLDWGGFSNTDILGPSLQDCDAVWVVCDQSIGGIISTTELLRQLRSQSMLPACAGLVVNRFLGNSGLPAASIAERLQIPLLATINDQSNELLHAASNGQLLYQSGRGLPYMQSVQQLAQLLSGKEMFLPGKAALSQQQLGPRFQAWMHRLAGKGSSS